jgi:predicted small secreted protein
MNKIFLIAAILASILGTSACNTIEGAGTDIQNLGTGMKRVAN